MHRDHPVGSHAGLRQPVHGQAPRPRPRGHPRAAGGGLRPPGRPRPGPGRALRPRELGGGQRHDQLPAPARRRFLGPLRRDRGRGDGRRGGPHCRLLPARRLPARGRHRAHPAAERGLAGRDPRPPARRLRLGGQRRPHRHRLARRGPRPPEHRHGPAPRTDRRRSRPRCAVGRRPSGLRGRPLPRPGGPRPPPSGHGEGTRARRPLGRADHRRGLGDRGPGHGLEPPRRPAPRDPCLQHGPGQDPHRVGPALDPSGGPPRRRRPHRRADGSAQPALPVRPPRQRPAGRRAPLL